MKGHSEVKHVVHGAITLVKSKKETQNNLYRAEISGPIHFRDICMRIVRVCDYIWVIITLIVRVIGMSVCHSTRHLIAVFLRLTTLRNTDVA